MLFLGLYDDAPLVSRYLQTSGVRVDGSLSTPFAPELSLKGTATTVLEERHGRSVLVVLGDTQETLNEAVNRLFSGEFRE